MLMLGFLGLVWGIRVIWSIKVGSQKKLRGSWVARCWKRMILQLLVLTEYQSMTAAYCCGIAEHDRNFSVVITVLFTVESVSISIMIISSADVTLMFYCYHQSSLLHYFSSSQVVSSRAGFGVRYISKVVNTVNRSSWAHWNTAVFLFRIICQ